MLFVHFFWLHHNYLTVLGKRSAGRYYVSNPVFPPFITGTGVIVEDTAYGTFLYRRNDVDGWIQHCSCAGQIPQTVLY